MKASNYLLAASFCLSQAACVSGAVSVAQPTAVERQLIGVYRQLDDELVRQASFRGQQNQPQDSLSLRRALALEQRAIQRFNEDDLQSLRQEGCVVENYQALIEARDCAVTQDEPVWARRRQRIIADENRARKTIMDWAAYRTAIEKGLPIPSATLKADIVAAYRALLRSTLQEGEWYEDSSGQQKQQGETR